MNNMRLLKLSGLLFSLLFVFDSCKQSSGSMGWEQPPQVLPVFAVASRPATVYREYTASIEGTSVVEIRPQVEGTLEKIYADEGSYVKKGQPLFQINDRPYREQLDNARAGLAAAKAAVSNAEINVSRLEPLVKNNVISDVQLKTAQAALDAAKANEAQAEAMMRNAEINFGYALIKAPVDGYIGRIPFKVGSLVGMGMIEPLTVLSETKEVYAYFSLSETDFMQFKNEFTRTSMEEKIKEVPPVELVLADGSIYPLKGKVETVSGQFSSSTGTISFRAVFENPDGMLRSGNTGKVRIPRQLESALVIPQESTYELQDKVFVFVLADSNKVVGAPIDIDGTSGNYYLVDKGLKPGDKVVYSGIDRLRDSVVIQPVPMSFDSLLKARPL
jgi:membrane fusion protein (multidrug efflux system)